MMGLNTGQWLAWIRLHDLDYDYHFRGEALDEANARIAALEARDSGDWHALLAERDSLQKRVSTMREALQVARKRMLRYGERPEDIGDIDAALADSQDWKGGVDERLDY